MYIKKLILAESYPSEKVIREITFKKGSNFIVDARKTPAQRGNGIGKTTALKVLDICLGAKDRKYIYTDHEMDLENTDLKSYINDSKIFATLILGESFDEGAIEYTLKVGLFERGFRYIDDEKYSLVDFHKELNKLIFFNQFDKPTFRQLIGMFVRINQKSDNDKFLKYQNNFSSDVDYENIYSYLFRLTDHAAGAELLSLKERKKSLESDIKKLKSLNSISSINVIEQMLITVDKQIDATKKKLSVLVDIKEMQKNEDALVDVRSQYAALSEAIDRSGFKSERYLSIIEEAEAESEKSIDLSVLRNLHDEVKKNFADIGKTFNDLVTFNKQLVTNKLDYFKAQLQQAQATLSELTRQREQLLEKYKDVVVLIKNNDMDSYITLQGKLEDTLREKGKLEKVLELYGRLSESLAECIEQIGKIDAKSVNPTESIAAFNEYFTPYSEKITKEAYLLYLTEKTFPIGITNAKAGLSTGTKKSVISAFDLAYQSYAVNEHIDAPRFIVHDVIETMDAYALDNTIQLVNEIGCQYIVAVLKEKVENSKYVKDDDIRLALAEDNKLFRM